jgi:hypothetical protein
VNRARVPSSLRKHLRIQKSDSCPGPSTFVMSDTPVEVQFTSAGCLNYPCRTPHRRYHPRRYRQRRLLPFTTGMKPRRAAGFN